MILPTTSFVATFLLEVGTEELPADFSRFALPQLEAMVCRDLAQKRLSHGSIKSTSTPRRIVLIVEELPSWASDSEEVRKGPPEEQAFKNGVPTKAAIGFAKRYQIDVSQLEIRDTPKGSFVFAKVINQGSSTLNLLTELIPHWIGDIQGRRFMRWGTGERRFSRPIRWLVALLDKDLVPVSLSGTDPEVNSGSLSKGHRLHKEDVCISSSEDYFSIMRQAGVHVDRKERGDSIRKLINDAASELNAIPDLSEELFEELIELVESPQIIKGKFHKSYLDLPTEVLCTVMRVHQRYIPLFHNLSPIDPLLLTAKNNLLSTFLCISNGLNSAESSIKLGNERVLRARLEDAKFFIEADLAIKSEKRNDELKRVTFADGLGSLLDRTSRIEFIAKILIDQLGISHIDANRVSRAARLCKHDLVSQIVGEFPELQGLMGAKYLLAEGEHKDIALGVLEHYLPRSAGDQLPSSDIGAVLALAERLELMTSIFSKGERPSGSSDPYALRRAGNGILQIIWSRNWTLDIYALIQEAVKHWMKLLPSLDINMKSHLIDLSDFFRQRIISLLEEDGIDVDLVQAVAGQTIPIKSLLFDPMDIRRRAELLVQMRKSDELSSVQAVVTRASRLAVRSQLDKSVLSANDVVDSNLFEKSSEKNMLRVLDSLEPIAISYSADRYELLARHLASSSKALAEFFDGEDSVLVMCDDSSIRTNRLNLLQVLCNQASVIADFNQIRN